VNYDDPFLEPIGAKPIDLKDPKQLADQLEMLAGGLEQQAASSRSLSAMQGHPYPAGFYADAARAMRAAKAMIAAGSQAEAKKDPVKKAG
jgi:hypothetical protein